LKLKKAFLGLSLFCIFISIAMLNYPGGSLDNHHSKGYHFWGNFLSELGTIKSYLGAYKWTSTIFFVLALCTLGITIGKIISWHAQLMKGIMAKQLKITGWIAITFFTAISIAPFDYLLIPHLLLSIGCILVLSWFHLLLLSTWYSNRVFSKPFYAVNFCMLILLTFYLLMSVAGPNVFMMDKDVPQADVILQASSQKAIFIGMIPGMLLQLYFLEKHLKNE
jgi:hypothetical protein